LLSSLEPRTKNKRNESAMPTESKWATRFVWVAIFQGGLSALLSVFLLLGEINVLPIRVSLLISTTIPGIWIALGYVAYVIIGTVGMAVTALFYHYLEVNLKSSYKGISQLLGWLHLILGNVGIAGTSWLIMYVGYVTAMATLPTSFGGSGLPLDQVESSMVGGFLVPITLFAGVTILGLFLGGVGYVLVYRARPQASA
jgi:hypothetical protein